MKKRNIKNTTLSFRISEELSKKLRMLAELEGTTMTGWLERAINTAEKEKNDKMPNTSPSNNAELLEYVRSSIESMILLRNEGKLSSYRNKLASVDSYTVRENYPRQFESESPPISKESLDEGYLRLRNEQDVAEILKKIDEMETAGGFVNLDVELGDIELWRDRQNKNEKPIDFLRRVHGKRIDAGLFFQSDLVGQRKTHTNQNPRKGIDPTLYYKLIEQCRNEKLKLSSVLPNYSTKSENHIHTLLHRRLRRRNVEPLGE